MIKRFPKIVDLPVDEIKIAERLRDVRAEGVATLVDAIRDHGFVGRIVVRRKKTGDFVMDGAHRLTAMRELGSPTIPCDVIQCNDTEARIFELDGNLVGAKMTPLELSYFLAERRRVFQALHPEARRGGKRVEGEQSDTRSLCQTIALERGMSERHIMRLMSAGAALEHEEYTRLAKGQLQVSLKDLLNLSKVGDAQERGYVINAMAEGLAKKTSIARAMWKTDTGNDAAKRTAADVQFSRLKDNWDRASQANKARFVRTFAKELEQLLAGGQDG